DDKIQLNRRMNATLEGMAQALFKSWFVDFDPVLDNALAAGNPIPEELAGRTQVRRRALADGTADRETAKQFPDAFQFNEGVGWIPEGWEVKPIAEQVSITMGQSPSSAHYNKNGDGLPFHQGVTNYGERFPKHVQYSTGGNRYAEQGDILFSVRAPVGRINISDCRIIIGRGLSALRQKKNYQGFLVYLLKHVFQKEDLIGTGTIFNAVNKKEMESLPYITPSDGLAIAFNNIANSLDEKISGNAEQTESLTKLRDTLLPKLISGELRIPDAQKSIEEALT
ncbi:MAG: restriction endonuclease subunit S, partial [bacterium]|nr:restriction endonuclease subunit S [bacterium]